MFWQTSSSKVLLTLLATPSAAAPLAPKAFPASRIRTGLSAVTSTCPTSRSAASSACSPPTCTGSSTLDYLEARLALSSAQLYRYGTQLVMHSGRTDPSTVSVPQISEDMVKLYCKLDQEMCQNMLFVLMMNRRKTTCNWGQSVTLKILWSVQNGR